MSSAVILIIELIKRRRYSILLSDWMINYVMLMSMHIFCVILLIKLCS